MSWTNSHVDLRQASQLLRHGGRLFELQRNRQETVQILAQQKQEASSKKGHASKLLVAMPLLLVASS